MKVFKEFFVTVICISCIFTQSVFSMQQVQNEHVYSVDFTLPKIQFEKDSNNNQWIYIDGWYQNVNENGFKLPSNIYSVKIPPNTSVVDFTISDIVEVACNDICLTRYPVIKTQSTIESFGEGYFSQLKTSKFCSLKYIRKENDGRYAIFYINPFEYVENDRLLKVRKTFKINLVLSDASSPKILDKVKPVDKFDHCIVVRGDQIPLILEYKCFLEKRGVRTILFEYERIENYTGSNSQVKLRKALNDMYLKNGIESVFIIGKDSNIPMAILKPFGRDSEKDNIVLSDFYYADLTSEWDSNMNGYYGEFENDRVDLSAEILIGRLPLNKSSEITSYLSHLMSFLEEDKEKRQKILSAGAWLNFKEEKKGHDLDDCSDIDGGQIVYTNYVNYFSNYQYTGLYEQEGLKISKVANQGEKLTYENFISSYNDIDPLIVLLSGHGNNYGISRRIWDNDENRNKIADRYEIRIDEYLDLLSLYEIDTHHYSMVFADSCSTCNPTGYESLGERFIENTAVGYLGYSASAYFFLLHDSSPANFETNTSCFGLMANIEYFFTKTNNIGRSIKDATDFYWENCQKSFERKYLGEQVQNIYAMCYYGEPLLTLEQLNRITDQVYESQGLLEKDNKQYNIKEVSISEDSNSYYIKCNTYEHFGNKDYSMSMFLDSDMDNQNGIPDSNGAECFIFVGFNDRGEFLNGCLKWNPYIGDFYSDPNAVYFNNYCIDQYDSSITLRIPRTYIEGNVFAYSLAFSNKEIDEASFFPEVIEDSKIYAKYPQDPNPEDPPENPEPDPDPEPKPQPPNDPPPNPPKKPEPPKDPEPDPQPPKEPEDGNIVRKIFIQLKIGDLYALVNDDFVKLDIAPLEKDDRVFVPLRFIAESFGAEIEWKEDESNNGEGTIKITYTKVNSSKILVQMHTLYTTAYITFIKNDTVVKTEEIQLDVAPFIVKPENRTVVPVRFISESFGATIEWDETTKTIKILLQEKEV